MSFAIKTTIIFNVIISVILQNAKATENKLVEVNKRNILFLAHFNSKPEPDVYRGKCLNFNAEVTSGSRGVPFENSIPAPECLNLSKFCSAIIFPGMHNIDVKKGTLQFWVKPCWKKSKYLYALFFKFCSSPDKRKAIEWRGNNAFMIGKPPRSNAFHFGQERCSVTKSIPCNQNTWYQIAATWNAKTKKKKMYVNGILVGTEKYLIPDAPPNEIVLGSPGWRYDAHCLIDEMRILNIILTPEEIVQDYRAQKAGVEFKNVEASKAYSPNIFSPLKVRDNKKQEGYLGQEFYALRTSKKIKLDGNLNEAEWAKAPVVTNLLTRDGKIEKHKTVIKILYDNENLYFGVEANEPDMKNLRAQYDQRDLPVYSDDCFEVVFDTKNSYKTFYHFVTNTIGGIYDAKAGNSAWTSKNSYSSGIRGKNGWTVELKIPFRDLGVNTPVIGEIWGVRLGRECKPGRYVASLPQVKTGGYNARKFLGKLVFKGGDEAVCKCKANISVQKFYPGLNKVLLQLKNMTRDKIQLRVVSSLFDGKNNILKSLSSIVLVEPGKQKNTTLKIPVRNDSAESLCVAVYDREQNVIYEKKLECGFLRLQPSIKRTAELLPMLKRDCEAFRRNKHPLYSGAVKSVEIMDCMISEYMRQLDLCMKDGRIISPERWNKIAAAVNGFNTWREKRKFLLWKISPWEYGAPGQLPPMEYDEYPTVNFTQAGNERETVAFAVSSLLAGEKIDIRFVPHGAGNSKHFISADKFHVYYEPFVDNGFGKTITAPLIESSGNIVSLYPGTTQRIWIVFDSKGVPAGNYKGVIKIKSLIPGKLVERNIPVRIKVWNFSLPETNDWPLDCFLWNSMRSVYDETATMRLMHKYHIKWTMALAGNYTRGLIERKFNYLSYLPKKTKYKAEFKNEQDNKVYKTYFNPERLGINDDFFIEAKQLKMKVVFSWGNTDHPDWRKLMSQHLLKLGLNNSDILFQAMRDEFTSKNLARDVFFLKKIKQASPEVQLMSTYYSAPPPAGVTLEQLKEAVKYVKVWNLISNFLWGPKQKRQEMIDYFRRHKRTIWTYRCSRQIQDQPLLEYVRFYPWRAYMAGIDGISYWISMSITKDPFDHRDGYDEGFLYRGINGGVIPTKRFEALREGLEDVAYMDIFKKTLTALKKRYPKRDFAKFQKILERCPKIIQDNSQKEVDKWRLELGNAIDKLKLIK
jgi:hypothetical protein